MEINNIFDKLQEIHAVCADPIVELNFEQMRECNAWELRIFNSCFPRNIIQLTWIDLWFFGIVKSHFREGLDNLMKKSKVKLNIEAPQDVVDDSTKEIIRLKFKVWN